MTVRNWTSGVRVTGAVLLLALSVGAPAALTAQEATYTRLDARRPLETEDAFPLARYGFELAASPVQAEVADGGWRWLARPELGYGILPRTEVRLAAPIFFGGGGGGDAGVTGFSLSALRTLRLESPRAPALAVRAGVQIPAAPARAYGTVKGIATRTLPFARLHLNAGYRLGGAAAAADAESSGTLLDQAASRWTVGLAADRRLPLRALLLGAEVYAGHPLRPEDDLRWGAGVGLRAQPTRSWVVDAGVGRRFTGSERAWYARLGAGYRFAWRALIPVSERGGPQ